MKYLGLMVALAIVASLCVSAVVMASDPPQVIIGGGCIGGTQGQHYECPVCGKTLTWGQDINFATVKDSLLGFDRVVAEIKCTNCGYTNTHDGRGGLVPQDIGNLKYQLLVKKWASK